jgi:hypothetical protein
MTNASNTNIFDQTISRLEEAGHTHNRLAMIDLFADDIIVRSPITQIIRFEGVAQARDLFMHVFDHIADIKFYKVIGQGSDEQVIFWRGRVGRTYLEEANLLKMNEKGQICEMTVFMRAIPGLIALAADLAPALARKQGLVRWLIVSVALKTVAFLYNSAEPIVIKVAGVGVPVRDHD